MAVVAASAGGLSALATMLGGLPADFPIPLAVVQHIDPNRVSMMAEILGRSTTLHVKQASDREVLAAGFVYIAPPAAHMLIKPGLRIELGHDKAVHFVRPSADRLFESAARTSAPVIGIVLTGTGLDGASGVTAVKAAGGFVIVQDKASS